MSKDDIDVVDVGIHRNVNSARLWFMIRPNA
jgi:hypothetical protein